VSEHQNPARGAALCLVQPIHAAREAPGCSPDRGGRGSLTSRQRCERTPEPGPRGSAVRGPTDPRDPRGPGARPRSRGRGSLMSLQRCERTPEPGPRGRHHPVPL